MSSDPSSQDSARRRQHLQQLSSSFSSRVSAKNRTDDMKLAQKREDERVQLQQQLEEAELQAQRAQDQATGLEHRLDALRARNRQLEAQQRRANESSQEEVSVLREELRRRAQKIR